MKPLLLFVSLLLISSCQSVGFWVANRGVTLDQVTVTTNLAYGKETWQKLDLYVPKRDAKAVIVVYLYGGGWTSGKRGDYRFVAERLTQHGYTVVIPDYAHYPPALFPSFVEDSAAAVAWADDYAVGNHILPRKLVVMGHSAGAYNGAMLVADDRYLAVLGKKAAIVDGFIGLAGPYDFTPTEEKYKTIFNHMDDYSPMQVPTHLSDNEPPMLLLHGADDDTVYPRNTHALAKAAKNKGVDVREIIYPDVDHIQIVGALSSIGEGKAPVEEDVVMFIESLRAQDHK